MSKDHSIISDHGNTLIVSARDGENIAVPRFPNIGEKVRGDNGVVYRYSNVAKKPHRVYDVRYDERTGQRTCSICRGDFWYPQ